MTNTVHMLKLIKIYVAFGNLASLQLFWNDIFFIYNCPLCFSSKVIQYKSIELLLFLFLKKLVNIWLLLLWKFSYSSDRVWPNIYWIQ